MTTALAPIIDSATIARVILHGDLSKLSDAQKVSYYNAVCDSVGLNPLTQPFQYVVLNGREVLYCTRAGSEQLRTVHRISVQITAREVVDDCYVVTARATTTTARQDESIGAVPIAGLKGEARANAMMKAETKSKRRVTLAICGLGMLDETEVASLPADVVDTAPAPPPPARESRWKKIDRKYREAEALAAAPPEADRTPGPALVPGAVTVLRVDAEKTQNAYVTRWRITFSTGEAATTVKEWLAGQAERYRDSQQPVRADIKKTKHGTELLSLTTVEEARPPAPDPTPDDGTDLLLE